MRIGIITYHWAINYGAVAQAYALQTYLEKMGHTVEFINYTPASQSLSFFRKYIGKNVANTKLKWKNAKRTSNFKNFQSKLNIGNKRYTSYTELKNNPPDYNVYICGSDQIWNYDLVKVEGDTIGIANEYYLNFGDDSIIRVAYAPSFGSGTIPESLKDQIRDCLQRFKALSVREKSGVDLVKSLGFEQVSWMPDPTFLLNSEDYLNFKIADLAVSSDYVYSYILEGQDEIVKKILKVISNNWKNQIYNIYMGTNLELPNCSNHIPSPEQWFHYIKNSKFVVTNSFHSTVFALIFHRPFLVLPLNGKAAGRNSRLISLLTYLGLENRLLWEHSSAKINELNCNDIDWVQVDEKITKWRSNAEVFITKSLN